MTTTSIPAISTQKAPTFFSTSLPMVGKKVALVAISVLFSSLFLFLTGKSLTWIASKLLSSHTFTKIIPYLQKAGRLLVSGSEYILLAISVPLYSTFYILPKWLLHVALPHVGKMISKWGIITIQKVLIPFANFLLKKIDYLKNGALQLTRWTLAHIAQPLGKFCVQAWTFIQPKICSICEKILLGFRWIATQVKNLLTPVFHCIRTWAGYVGTLFQFTVHHIISPLWKKFLSCVTSLASHIVRSILKPMYYCLQYLFHKSMSFIHYIERNIQTFSKWTLTHILQPLLQETVTCMKIAGHFLHKQIFIPLLNTIKSLSTRIGECAQYVHKKWKQLSSWTFHHILEPLFTTLTSCVKWLFQKVIAPLFKQVSKKTQIASLWLYHHAIVPVAKAIFQFLQFTWKGVYNASLWLYSHIILPLAEVTSSITYKVARALQKLGLFIIDSTQILLSETKKSAIQFYKKLISLFEKTPQSYKLANT